MDTGTVNVYVVAANPAITSYPDRLRVTFTAATSNTGPATFNLNGIGSINITRYDGTPLQPNDIPAGAVMTLTYSAASNSFQTSTAGPQGSVGQTGASPADFLLFAQGVI